MTLHNSPAEVVAWLLITNLGLGTDPLAEPQGLWPVGSDGEPDYPDNCVTVTDTQGVDSGRTMGDGEVLRHWGFQVRVRSTDKPTGWQKIEAIRDALEKAYSQVVVVPADVGTGSTSYMFHCAAKIGQTLPLGTDSPNSKRHLFTLNAVAAVRQLGQGY